MELQLFIWCQVALAIWLIITIRKNLSILLDVIVVMSYFIILLIMKYGIMDHRTVIITLTFTIGGAIIWLVRQFAHYLERQQIIKRHGRDLDDK